MAGVVGPNQTHRPSITYTYGTTAERKEDAGEGEAQPRWPLGLRVPAVVDTPDDDSTRTLGDHVQVKLELPEHNHELYAEFKKHGIAFGAEHGIAFGPPQPAAEFEGAAVGSGLRASDEDGNTDTYTGSGGSRAGGGRVTLEPPAQCAGWSPGAR